MCILGICPSLEKCHSIPLLNHFLIGLLFYCWVIWVLYSWYKYFIRYDLQIFFPFLCWLCTFCNVFWSTKILNFEEVIYFHTLVFLKNKELELGSDLSIFVPLSKLNQMWQGFERLLRTIKPALFESYLSIYPVQGTMLDIKRCKHDEPYLSKSLWQRKMAIDI